MKAIGIDLGTTNSVVAVYERGTVRTVPVFGHRKTPSVVCWHPDSGACLVGREAKNRVLLNPELSVVSNKKFMGDRQYVYDILGRSYSPVDIAALILEFLVKGAAEALNHPIHHAVITVPAYFNQNQKEDTRLAAEAASLEVLALQAEPTAAAIAYGYEQNKNQKLLVYDLGGGTFDVSLLEIRDNRFTVKAIGGDPTLGGDNFDQALMDFTYKEIKHAWGIDLREEESKEARALRQQLKELAETAKIELGTQRRAHLNLPPLMGRQALEILLTQEAFNALIQPHIDHTENILNGVLADAGLHADEVNRVICVGGSTKTPLVHETLTKKVKTPFNASNVDEIVAHGAAITAADCQAPDLLKPQDRLPVSLDTTNVTPLNLGIRLDKDLMGVLVNRNTTIPVTAEREFTTTRDFATQTDIVVYQGNHSHCGGNAQLGGFRVKGIQKARAGIPRIKVSFTLTENDLLEIEAADLSTRSTNSLIIEKFQPQPFHAEQRVKRNLEDLNIGVSPIGYDDVGAILTKMRLGWTKIKNHEFRKIERLKNYDVLFINCLAGGSCTKNREALQSFVADGGVLYASDCAQEHLQAAFPGALNINGNGAFTGRVQSYVEDAEFRQVLQKEKMYINFNSVLYYCDEVNHPEGQVFITGNYKGLTKPILVGFPHGNGYVVFTAFHNYSSATREEMELLKFVVLKPLSLVIDTPLSELAER